MAAYSCKETAMTLTQELKELLQDQGAALAGIETDLCGECFAVCAYTRKYIATQK